MFLLHNYCCGFFCIPFLCGEKSICCIISHNKNISWQVWHLAFHLSQIFISILIVISIVPETKNGPEEMLNNKEEEDTDLHYVDETHHTNLLASLNMMRKNKHFCDVILHVCALAVHHHFTCFSQTLYRFEL